MSQKKRSATLRLLLNRLPEWAILLPLTILLWTILLRKSALHRWFPVCSVAFGFQLSFRSLSLAALASPSIPSFPPPSQECDETGVDCPSGYKPCCNRQQVSCCLRKCPGSKATPTRLCSGSTSSTSFSSRSSPSIASGLSGLFTGSSCSFGETCLAGICCPLFELLLSKCASFFLSQLRKLYSFH